MMVIAELHDEAFLDYIKGVKHSFTFMIETMINVAEMIKDETQKNTPVLTGKLSRSFRWKILTDNSRMKVLQIQMSALNERTGYDYAWIQHENFGYNHDTKNLGFFNYEKSYIDDTGFIEWGNIKHSTIHKGKPWYLRSAIVTKQNSAFEMIERDYMSLFEYGGIF